MDIKKSRKIVWKILYISLICGLVGQLAMFRDTDTLAILGLLYIPAWLICIASSITLATGSLIFSDDFKNSWKDGSIFQRIILILGTLIITAVVGFISYQLFTKIFWSDEVLDAIFDF